MDTPLSGIRVLDLTRLFPGAYASQQLALLGAEVVRVESPGGGDWLRDLPVIFAALNRGKRSIAIDLKNQYGKTAFLRLVSKADLLFESFRPGVMEKLGLGFDQLVAVKPDIIYCRLSGYGSDGPYAERAGHDLNYAALSGLLYATGTVEGELAIPSIQVGDLAGATSAVTGVLAALLRRERTGAGGLIETSMFEGLLSWLTPQFVSSIGLAQVEQPGVGWLTGGEPCYHLYRCKDGWMAVAAIEPKFWNQLVNTLGLGEFLQDGHARGKRGLEVMDRIEAAFLQRTRDEWSKEFAKLDVCCEPVLNFIEAANQPQVKERQLFDAHGSVASPVRMTGQIVHSVGAAPKLGEHTDELLLDAAFSQAEIAQLRASGAVL